MSFVADLDSARTASAAPVFSSCHPQHPLLSVLSHTQHFDRPSCFAPLSNLVLRHFNHLRCRHSNHQLSAIKVTDGLGLQKDVVFAIFRRTLLVLLVHFALDNFDILHLQWIRAQLRDLGPRLFVFRGAKHAPGLDSAPHFEHYYRTHKMIQVVFRDFHAIACPGAYPGSGVLVVFVPLGELPFLLSTPNPADCNAPTLREAFPLIPLSFDPGLGSF
ncbi:hypothetical protein EXIGLDRAFT_781419 [Exidia glandulosa HHB12029]|uniref:Uncharacterized protein n=1 Tax=Exidia glandulosa HHB12029 TaxID=1314781 RepID=A0A165B9D3_EXIGL|nr:hypothetical protein EXIGLDRAFT_781419 [Exidia glandulosa HHB12029]